ncbi:MAG: ABC transporter ATP-binding protein [Pseudomonadota bacterium]
MSILRIQDLHKSFGALKATDGVTMDVSHDEIHAVIGPNGAGKTTLVAQICGQLAPDSGTMNFLGNDITALPQQKRVQAGLVRSFQITSVFPDFTALENVAMTVQLQQSHSFRFWKSAARDATLLDPAMAHLHRVGLADHVHRPVHALAHGQQRQLELAMALAVKPKLMVLDEPMAGMGLEESARVVDLLRSLRGEVAMLLVEHDMDAVFQLADRISVMVYGRLIATGTVDEIRGNEEVRRAYLGEDA